MSQISNPSGAREQELAKLTATAQIEHLAVGHALNNALQHAMAAGDALVGIRELVPAGTWQAHLRAHTDIKERTARVYIQVAKARTALERQSSAGPLSIAAALQYLKDPEASRRSSTKTKTAKAATSFDALGWWSGATSEARQHFLDGVGLLPILAAMPKAWRPELERRAAKSPRAKDEPFIKASEILRRALSLTKIATTTPGITPVVAASNEKEAIVALRKLNDVLTGADIDDVTIVRQYAKEGRRAA